MSIKVRAAVLTNYIEVAQQLGLNARSLLLEVGLNQTMLLSPDQRIPMAAAAALLEASVRDSGCLTFGLMMAESRQLSDMGAISLLLTHQRTLRDVLCTCIQYRHLLNESLAMYVEDAGNKVILRQELVGDALLMSRQAIELAIGVLFRMCAAQLGTHWRPDSVNFTHSAPPQLQLHRRMFGCPIEFNSDFNGIVCDAADLDVPNPVADPAMARYAQGFIDTLPRVGERSIIQEIRSAIYLLLPVGRASTEQVALGLGLSVRAMQRQLTSAGLVYSDLVNEVRRDLVLKYIANPTLSLVHIAELVGYSTPSSFTRWFSSQFGVAPAHWRKTQHPSPKMRGQG